MRNSSPTKKHCVQIASDEVSIDYAPRTATPGQYRKVARPQHTLTEVHEANRSYTPSHGKSSFRQKRKAVRYAEDNDPITAATAAAEIATAGAPVPQAITKSSGSNSDSDQDSWVSKDNKSLLTLRTSILPRPHTTPTKARQAAPKLKPSPEVVKALSAYKSRAAKGGGGCPNTPLFENGGSKGSLARAALIITHTTRKHNAEASASITAASKNGHASNPTSLTGCMENAYQVLRESTPLAYGHHQVNPRHMGAQVAEVLKTGAAKAFNIIDDALVGTSANAKIALVLFQTELNALLHDPKDTFQVFPGKAKLTQLLDTFVSNLSQLMHFTRSYFNFADK